MNNRQQRLIFFLVVWFTMISFVSGWGQKPFAKEQKKDFLHLHYPGLAFSDLHSDMPLNENLLFSDISHLYEEQPCINGHITQNQYIRLNWRIAGTYAQPSDLYYLQSGYFCKREWELEKATHIPLRFRLGSLADCNALEGKH